MVKRAIPAAEKDVQVIGARRHERGRSQAERVVGDELSLDGAAGPPPVIKLVIAAERDDVKAVDTPGNGDRIRDDHAVHRLDEPLAGTVENVEKPVAWIAEEAVDGVDGVLEDGGHAHQGGTGVYP